MSDISELNEHSELNELGEPCDSNSDLEDTSSICDELQELLDKCQETHTHLHNSIETLNTLHTLINNSNNIQITINGVTSDFDDVLEHIHLKCLETGDNFGEELLDVIENGDFQ